MEHSGDAAEKMTVSEQNEAFRDIPREGGPGRKRKRADTIGIKDPLQEKGALDPIIAFGPGRQLFGSAKLRLCDAAYRAVEEAAPEGAPEITEAAF